MRIIPRPVEIREGSKLEEALTTARQKPGIFGSKTYVFLKDEDSKDPKICKITLNCFQRFWLWLKHGLFSKQKAFETYASSKSWHRITELADIPKGVQQVAFQTLFSPMESYQKKWRENVSREDHVSNEKVLQDLIEDIKIADEDVSAFFKENEIRLNDKWFFAGLKKKELRRVLEEKRPEVINASRSTALKPAQPAKVSSALVQKTLPEKWNSGQFNPFRIDYQANGKYRTAKEQAAEIFQDIQTYLSKNEQGKVAITYSANSDQAQDIYKGYKNGNYSISGANQAEVFHHLVEMIKENNRQDQVHVLPIPTCLHSGGGEVSKQEHVVDAMKNIAKHLGANWTVLVLQNQDTTADQPYAIGGGVAGKVWSNTEQQKYTHTCLMDFFQGTIPESLKESYEEGKEHPEMLLR